MKTENANRLTDSENLNMPGFKAFLTENKNDNFIKIDKTEMATVASFSVSHENRQC